jgi:hypothetical protein
MSSSQVNIMNNPYAINPTERIPLSQGQTLDQILRVKGLTQTEAALRTGVTRQYLNTVIKGKAPFTTELQTKLKSLLGKDLEFWDQVAQRHEDFMKSPEGLRQVLAERENEISVQWDIHGPHTLLNFELETAVQAGVISICTQAGEQQINAYDPDWQLSTSYQLSLGEVVEIIEPDGKKRRGSENAFIKRGEVALLETRELIKIGGRVRIHLNGTCGDFAAFHIGHIGTRVIEPWHAGAISFQVFHFGSKPVELKLAEPCIQVSFEYLAMEPKRPVDPEESADSEFLPD